MKLGSDFREALTIMNSLHRGFGEERLAPIFCHQYQRWHSSSSFPVPHGGSGVKTERSQIWGEFVVARSKAADGHLLQLTESVNRTLSDDTFSRVSLH